MMPSDETSPTGGAWAAILAAAIGCATFGVVTDLAEMSKRISSLLNLHSPTGDLSGKSTIGVAAWLAAWVILHLRWNGRTIAAPGRITLITVALVALAMLLVFPPFVDAITGH